MKIEEHVVYNNDVIGREIPYEKFRNLFSSYKIKKAFLMVFRMEDLKEKKVTLKK